MTRRQFIAFMGTAAAVASLGGLARAWPMGEGKKGKEFAFTMTDQQWKEKLSPEAYNVLRQEGTERAFTAKAFLPARVADRNSIRPTRNLNPAPAGRLSGRRSRKARWAKAPITRSAWPARKCIAPIAAGILAMSLKTGQSRRACAIA